MMKPRVTAEACKVMDTGETPEPGYDAWKRRKVERGLAEAETRDQLIPAEQVWRDLGLEP
jgi:hypothetical protein